MFRKFTYLHLNLPDPLDPVALEVFAEIRASRGATYVRIDQRTPERLLDRLRKFEQPHCCGDRTKTCGEQEFEPTLVG